MEFQNKVSSLIKKNTFLEVAKEISSITYSENGAIKYSTTNNIFVDNFAAASHFKEPRSYQDVEFDMNNLWSVNPKMCIQLAFYMRIITRKPKVCIDNTVEVLDMQRGAGLKHEGIMRMLWLAVNHPKEFIANLPLYIAIASWKDIFQMLSLDLQFHGWEHRKLNWNYIYEVIIAGLQNSATTHLVRKYLPTIRTNNKCTTLESQADTLIGRWLARRFNPKLQPQESYKEYRKIKSKGIAHEWQQLISKQLYNCIKFDNIAGRALALMVSSKFLENHNLIDKYTNWISSKPIAKFTGYVFELFSKYTDLYPEHLSEYQEKTINAQFNQLVQNNKNKSSLIVVRDVSGSMASKAIGCNVSSYCISKAMALYFSESLKGHFNNSYFVFSDTCKLKFWNGTTPTEKYVNDAYTYYGSTNFQSVIDTLIEIKQEGVSEEEFPTGLLVLSDGELNSCGTTTNFKRAIERLKKAGFSNEFVNNFKIILWDIPNTFYGKTEQKFESFADTPNFFYISGYDPSVITFLLGGDNPEFKAPKTAEELFLSAMNQEILQRIKIFSK